MTTEFVQGDLSDRDDAASDSLAAELPDPSAATPAPLSADRAAELKQNALWFGPNAMLPSAEWCIWLGIEPGAFAGGIRDREILETGFPNGKYREYGFAAQDVLTWIERKNVSWKRTVFVDALQSLSVVEGIVAAFNSDVTTTADQAAKLLGIARDTIVHVRGVSDPDRIPVQSLANWLQVETIKVPWSLSVARSVVRARHLAAVPERPAIDGEPKTTADAAFGILEAERQQEADFERVNRERMLVSYREILDRRNKPRKADAETLALLIGQLGFSQADVNRDIAALERLAELERLAADIEPARQNLEQASAARKAEKKRAELAERQMQSNHSAAFSRIRAATQAPNQIKELRYEFPHLLGAH